MGQGVARGIGHGTQTGPMGHAHVHTGRLPQHVRAVLAAALVPFFVATVVGLVVLWPTHAHPRAASDLGQSAELENATVTALRSSTCPGAGRCFNAVIALTSGPERGDKSVLTDLTFGPGAPVIHNGDRIVVGRTVDPTSHAVI